MTSTVSAVSAVVTERADAEAEARLKRAVRAVRAGRTENCMLAVFVLCLQFLRI